MTELFLTWWPVLLVVAQAGLGWVVWSLGKRFLPREEFEAYKDAHGDDHDEIGDRLQAGQTQFTRIEADLKHLPTRKDIEDLRTQLHQVDKGVIQLNGSIQVVAAKLGAVEKPVDLMMRIGMED